MDLSCCDTGKPIITCRNATLGYEGRAVVSGLDFTVMPGDYVTIVGENGSGKSTLMKTMLGLIKPMSGSISINCSKGSGCIGYLPQTSLTAMDFPATVKEVVLSGFLSKKGFHPFFTRKEKQEAVFLLEKVGIPELKDQPFRNLSGGQKQRVMLARALAATHEILMLDEPVTGLDAVATQELYASLRELNQTDRLTIIMVSHDMQQAILQSSKILHINKDDYFFGTTARYMVSEQAKMFFPDTEE